MLALVMTGTGCAAGGKLAPEVAAAPVPSEVTAQVPQRAPHREESLAAKAAAEETVHASKAHVSTSVDDGVVAAWRSPTADVAFDILSNTARCPAEMALVDDRICVDRWEGSLMERIPNGEERPWSPYLAVDGHEESVRAVSRPGVVPQGYISGEQAQKACMASGKRLCGADEWEHACRGPARARFPYGDERRSRVCNDDIRPTHPVVEVGILLGIPKEQLWFEGMHQPLINQLPNGLLETGARVECTNDYGVFDMVGNLHEWIDAREGTFRGGYYMDTTRNGEGCSYQTTAHDFRYHDYSTGFRCCMDPDRVE